MRAFITILREKNFFIKKRLSSWITSIHKKEFPSIFKFIPQVFGLHLISFCLRRKIYYYLICLRVRGLLICWVISMSSFSGQAFPSHTWTFDFNLATTAFSCRKNRDDTRGEQWVGRWQMRWDGPAWPQL